MDSEYMLEHSLPSHSQFYNENYEEYEEFENLEEKQVSYKSRHRERSVSPPPPPPPPPLSDTEVTDISRDSSKRRISQPQPASYHNEFDERPIASSSNTVTIPSSLPFASSVSRSSNKNPITPKPFLKKGSRKEPSRLNGSPVSPIIPKPEPVGSSNTNSSNNSNPNSSVTKSKQLSSTTGANSGSTGTSNSIKSTYTPATSNAALSRSKTASVSEAIRNNVPDHITDSKAFGEHFYTQEDSSHDILLQGSDYWNLEGTATSLLKAAGAENPVSSGTTRQDLDEFELLERQVEQGLGTAHGSTSRLTSDHHLHHPSSAGRQPQTSSMAYGSNYQTKRTDASDDDQDSDRGYQQQHHHHSDGYRSNINEEDLEGARRKRNESSSSGADPWSHDDTISEFASLEQLRRQPVDSNEPFGRSYSQSGSNVRGGQSPSWGAMTRGSSSQSSSAQASKQNKSSSLDDGNHRSTNPNPNPNPNPQVPGSRQINANTYADSQLGYVANVRNSYSSTDTASDMYSVGSDRLPVHDNDAMNESVRNSSSAGQYQANIIRTRPNLNATTSQVSGPTSTLISSGVGHMKAVPSIQHGRPKTPTPANTAAGRQQSPAPRAIQGGGGVANNNNNNNKNVAVTSSNASVPADGSLAAKARELEAEIETYKQENALVKSLRRQQESTLAEITKERNELLKWIGDEKAKTNAWCDEQRQAAMRERRAAARQSRDARTNLGTSVRKERAEIDALQATIEKLKIDSETQIKKLRTNERRLQQLVKDQTQKIEDIETDCMQLEEDRKILVAFVEKLSIRLPGNIMKIVSKEGAGQGSEARVIRRIRAENGSGSYVEEVDVDSSGGDAMSSFAVVTAISAKDGSDLLRRDGSETVNIQKGRLAEAIFSTSGHPSTVNHGGGTGESKPTNASSSTLRHPQKSPEVILDPNSRYSRPHTAGGLFSEDFGVTHPARVDGTRVPSSDSNVLKLSESDANQDAAGSWARSSRSSRGSRYSGGKDEESVEEDHGEVDRDYSKDSYKTAENRGSMTGNAGIFPAYGSGLVSVEHQHAQATVYSQHDTWQQQQRQQQPSQQAQQQQQQQLQQKYAQPSLSKPAGDDGAPNPNPSSNPSMVAAATAKMPISGNSDTAGNNSRTEEMLPDGRRRISYRNGTVKDVFPDGKSLVRFVNGDTKRTDPVSGIVIYYYAQAMTTHTTYKDGLEVYEFPNNQTERHYPDGSKEILFPDSTRKVIHIDGMQESHFSDGVVVREYSDGKKEILPVPSSAKR